MALIDTLQDNFNDNSFDTGKWTRSSGTLVLEQNQRMELVSGANAKNVRSTNSYDLTGSYLQFRYIAHRQGNVQPQVGLQIGTSISYTGGDRVAIDFNTSNQFRCVKAVGGTITYTTPIARGTYEYFRIREVSGIVYWDASTDGINWTNIWSRSPGFTITSLYAYAICTWISTASTNYLHFDNFNILNYDLQPPQIASTKQLFAPLVSPGPVDLLVTFITSTEQVFAMTLVAGPATLTLPSISGTTLYAPTLIAEPLLLIPFIDSSGQLYAMSIGSLVGIKPKGASGILRPEGYAIKDGPRVGTESARPGSAIPLPSPDVATEVVMAAIQPAAN